MSPSLPSILQSLGAPRLLVLGDLMLDRYTWGNAQRVSPEAPVLVLAADTHEVRLGGATSVASLLRGLEAGVALAGVVGDDPEGRAVRRLLEEAGIDHESVLTDPTRPTTTKERFVGRAAGRHPHQILRVDRESCQPIGPEFQDRLAASLLARLEKSRAVLISDYQKGVCTPGLLETVVRAAAAHKLPVLVDPARIADYTRYRGATLLAPNRAEAALAAGHNQIGTRDEAVAAGRRLREHTQVQAVIVKLDSEGMVLVSVDGTEEHLPTRPREVHDVTGAGDMVLAVLGLTLAEGVPLTQAIRLANVAAGLEVERLGIAPVAREELQAELVQQLRLQSPGPRAPVPSPQSAAPKLVTLEAMAALAESYRAEGRRVVLTNGCFDLLHVGHASYLKEAAALGDVLVVAVNSDRSVRALKGPGRPVIPEDQRAAMLAALECVGHVLVFDAPTPHHLLRRIRPDILVKGGTYTPDKVVGHEIVESYGGQVCVTGSIPDVSTTQILAAIHDYNSIPTHSEETGSSSFRLEIEPAVRLT